MRSSMARRSVQKTTVKAMPASLGFREGLSSVHTSRTMMLDELSLLLETVGMNGKAGSYCLRLLTAMRLASGRRRLANARRNGLPPGRRAAV